MEAREKEMTVDEKALKVFRALLRRPRTLKELEIEAGISRRTVFRYLVLLKDRGQNVERVGLTRPTKYRIGK